MVSKHNLGSSPSFTKHLYHDSINIRAKSIHLTDSNHLIITGNYNNSNHPAGLHIELDTNLTILNAYKYIDNDSNFSINFNKAINNCGINKTIGTLSNNAMSKGYLLSKEFITDSVCNQEGLTINDSTYSDTVVFETPEEQLTNEWTNINYTQADIDFYKQNCLTTNSLDENSTVIEINLYPNPTNTGNFKIESNEMIYSIELVNLLGETINFESTVNNKSFNFHCSNLQSGIYLVNIKYKSKTIYRKVIIDNH